MEFIDGDKLIKKIQDRESTSDIWYSDLDLLDKFDDKLIFEKLNGHLPINLVMCQSMVYIDLSAPEEEE